MSRSEAHDCIDARMHAHRSAASQRENLQPMETCHADPLQIAAYSTCPSGLWHERVAPLLASPEMVMLNIGANKGYNLVEFTQRYSAAPANLTHANWYSLLMQNGCAAQCCGVCRLCKAPRIPQQASAKLHLHAFELQPANAAMLEKLVKFAGLPVTVHSTAMSNYTGTVYTASGVRPGSESVGIARNSNSAKLIPRPVTTVDAFMAAHAVPRAHFASIDVEGTRCLTLHALLRVGCAFPPVGAR